MILFRIFSLFFLHYLLCLCVSLLCDVGRCYCRVFGQMSNSFRYFSIRFNSTILIHWSNKSTAILERKHSHENNNNIPIELQSRQIFIWMSFFSLIDLHSVRWRIGIEQKCTVSLNAKP